MSDPRLAATDHTDIDALLERNRLWASSVLGEDPDYFERLSQQQAPKYLWIGCSDSRVPANQITGMQPGEVFVHRNVGNVVVHADLNCLSVMQFAVDVLQVEHIIVCGHYGCGGVDAALRDARLGLVDNWIRHIGDVAQKHNERLIKRTPHSERLALLCELNVIEQAVNVCQTTVVRDAWARGQRLSIHGWIYALRDGLLRTLLPGVDAIEAIESGQQAALGRLDPTPDGDDRYRLAP